MADNEKLDLILTEIQEMKQDLHSVKQDLQGVKQDMQDEKQDMQGMKQDMQDVKQDIQDVKQQVTKTNLTIENEIRVNIQRVAEGHLDLSRKLNECIRLSSDIKDKQEIQDIFINMHDNKLKSLMA